MRDSVSPAAEAVGRGCAHPTGGTRHRRRHRAGPPSLLNGRFRGQRTGWDSCRELGFTVALSLLNIFMFAGKRPKERISPQSRRTHHGPEGATRVTCLLHLPDIHCSFSSTRRILTVNTKPRQNPGEAVTPQNAPLCSCPQTTTVPATTYCVPSGCQQRASHQHLAHHPQAGSVTCIPWESPASKAGAQVVPSGRGSQAQPGPA